MARPPGPSFVVVAGTAARSRACLQSLWAMRRRTRTRASGSAACLSRDAVGRSPTACMSLAV